MHNAERFNFTPNINEFGDQKQQSEGKLEALLLEGLNSGPAKPLTKADLKKVRREVRERATKKRRSQVIREKE